MFHFALALISCSVRPEQLNSGWIPKSDQSASRKPSHQTPALDFLRVAGPPLLFRSKNMLRQYTTAKALLLRPAAPETQSDPLHNKAGVGLGSSFKLPTITLTPSSPPPSPMLFNQILVTATLVTLAAAAVVPSEDMEKRSTPKGFVQATGNQFTLDGKR